MWKLCDAGVANGVRDSWDLTLDYVDGRFGGLVAGRKTCSTGGEHDAVKASDRTAQRLPNPRSAVGNSWQLCHFPAVQA
jgi:hypothetical protein